MSYDYGDDVDDYVEISAAASATTRDLTDEERAEIEEREKRRLPFGFCAPSEQAAA